MEIDICPRWLLASLGIPLTARAHFAIFLSTILLLAAVPIAPAIPHICLVRTLFGMPCPGCGVLHGLLDIALLKFGAAWQSNPAAFALAALFGFQILARPLALLAPRFDVAVNTASHRGSTVVLGLLLLVWIFRVTTGGSHGGYLLPQM